MTDRAEPTPRVDRSMSLLVDMMRDAQDPSYAAVARRARTEQDGAGRLPRRRRTVGGVAVLVLVGLATGTAAAGVRAGADDEAATRRDLIAEIGQRTGDSDVLSQETAELRRDVDASRSAGLSRDAAGRAQATQLRAVELAAAVTPVTGPGVVVEVDDRPAGKSAGGLNRGGQLGDGRVQDRDLQLLVNGLWLAGAEAISVNDLRLTVRTAIRSAGEAVLVDFRPVSPPYVVRAIGDPSRLEPDFVDGAAGRRFATYARVNGLGFSVGSRDRLELPAGSAAELVAAVPDGS